PVAWCFDDPHMQACEVSNSCVSGGFFVLALCLIKPPVLGRYGVHPMNAVVSHEYSGIPLKSRIFSKIRPYDNCLSLRKSTSRFSPYVSGKFSRIMYVVEPSVCGPTCAT